MYICGRKVGMVPQRWISSLEGVSEAGGNEGGSYVMFNVKSMVSRSSILLNFLSEGYMLTQKIITGMEDLQFRMFRYSGELEDASERPKPSTRIYSKPLEIPKFLTLILCFKNQSF